MKNHYTFNMQNRRPLFLCAVLRLLAFTSALLPAHEHNRRAGE
jgi:hypothetical protein